jgi:hypothetical protein
MEDQDVVDLRMLHFKPLTVSYIEAHISRFIPLEVAYFENKMSLISESMRKESRV